MSKNISRTILLSLCIVALMGIQAQAHYIYTSAGYLFHSFQCLADLKGVANPDTKPAEAECEAFVTQIDILCLNPSGKIVSGSSATQATLINTEQLTPANLTGKGKASTDIIIPDGALLNPQYCINPNWIPVQVIIREATATQNIYKCIGDDPNPCDVRELASTTESLCVLPAQFNFNNPPIVGVTPYNCTEVFSAH